MGNGGQVTSTMERLVSRKSLLTPTSISLASPDLWHEQASAVDLSPSDLALYSGEDQTRPIYLGIDGEVFDVTSSKRMYGPGGAYHCL